MKLAKKNLHIILSVVALAAAAFWIFTLTKNEVRPTSAYSAPEITMIATNNSKAIIYAHSTEPDVSEQFVYCVSNTEDSTPCSWETYDEFDDLKEGTYYAFVKSLASGRVSSAQRFIMKKIDYKNIEF